MSNPMISSREHFNTNQRERRVPVNGRNWGMLTAGKTGPALVLLPGTLGRADIFWNQIKDLRHSTRILALSYPSSGSLEDWAADICALMDQAGMEKATVLGTSLGGYIAQYMASAHPRYVEKLVAANTLHSAALVAQFPPYNSDLHSLPDATLLHAFVTSMKQWATEDPSRADLANYLTNEATKRIPADELRQRLIVLKEAPELPEISLPRSRIFTVESDDDRLIPPPIREAVHARLDPVQSFHFETGTHFPYILHAQEYTVLLKRVLGLTEPGIPL